MSDTSHERGGDPGPHGPFGGPPQIVRFPAPPPPRRRRRVLFRVAVGLAVLVTAGGAAFAVVEYNTTAGPDGAVRGYFDALARRDAPAALAFGRTPSGERSLLTSTVLAEQERIAPLRGVSVAATRRTGSTAQVDVRYTLDFPDDPQQISDTVTVHQVDGDWQLTATAVETAVGVEQAPQRASVLGAALPKGSVLLFPGAVPVRFDSPYLQLKASTASVSFGSGPTTDVYLDVSAGGRAAVLAALHSSLATCLAAAADPGCPVPTTRTVPGSLRATMLDPSTDKLSVDVGSDAAGTLEVTGSVQVSGSYRSLGFDNRVVTTKGAFDVPVDAVGYAVAPLRLRWVGPS